jgi:hypothetical protein
MKAPRVDVQTNPAILSRIRTYLNDIALLKLVSPYVSSMCLPSIDSSTLSETGSLALTLTILCLHL